MIQFRQVSVDVATSSGQRRILTVGELSILPGESVALVGPSGCGKTTLFSLVAGLRRPTSGTVVIAGTDLAMLKGYRMDLFRAAHVGIVFQSFHLLESSPVRRNVLLPLALTGRRGPAASAWADALLERVGLASRGGALPRQLSVGERQRVAVARALAGGAPLLLADEPTGNLDPDNTTAVLDLLLGHVGPGRTLVVATHETSILDRFDRVVDLRSLA